MNILLSTIILTFAEINEEIMGQKEIKNIDIKDFRMIPHILDYADEDFVIVNSLEEGPYSDERIRLQCFLIAFCIEGCVQLDINSRTYQLQAGDLLLGLPNTIISHAMLSPKYKVKLVCVSTRFLQSIVKIEKDTWDTAIHIHNNPVKTVGEKESKGIAGLYRNLIAAKISAEPHCYHKEVMQYLFSALLYEMLGMLNKEIVCTDRPNQPKEGMRQADYILRKFLEMLSKDNGMHRSVAYFADALCYTPKHFSKVIKQASGRTPLELINENCIQHIKHRLTHSDKSIKEIAEEFNFPNQSFFGKYVKMHLGTSPVSYRNGKEE